jgi:hypothetical protein
MKAFRALGALLCAGLICALGAGQAGAQSPLVLLGNATSPGGAHVDVGAFSIIGRDSGTGAPCIVSSSPTCSFGGAVTATIAPFTVVGTSTPITTGASSANTPITATSTLIVLTAGANDLYYKLGTSNAVTAASTDNYLGAGRSICIGIGLNTNIAGISPAGSSTLFVVGGTGGCPSLSGGGGVVSSGGASYTAAAAPYSVSAGANKPAGIDTANSAQFMELCKPTTTTCFDPTLPSGILGADGATIASIPNPFPTKDQASGATGSAPPANAMYQGALQSGVNKGVISCDTHAFYDGSTALKTIVAGVSAKKIYVCGWIAATDGTATNLSLTSGTGTDCVTTSVGITPAYNLAANDRVGDHTAWWSGLITLANADNLCGFASAANGHSFEIWYTVQ